MKKTLIIIALSSFFTNCVRESEPKKFCYLFINDTDRSVVMEQYRINSAGAFLENTYVKNGVGVLAESCKTDVRIPTVTEAYRVDSIVVMFDNLRKLSYRIAQEEQGFVADSIFFSDEWEDDPSNNNFYWRFTEEDYENAEPY
ncbi:hypothetical protein BST97_02700 [Nonlabens spongiae]|uniref:Uncharacterized protein n=1 Tax=Nonlabens spongiae TaxID=331648 RepID=A0A1W6MHA0_9FLAO|nr:hypothetical protein [Nonlabens spongiae]ARN76994.1 hypothetical protein BST97_02700 [Nonlabens spongiae]